VVILVTWCYCVVFIGSFHWSKFAEMVQFVSKPKNWIKSRNELAIEECRLKNKNVVEF